MVLLNSHSYPSHSGVCFLLPTSHFMYVKQRTEKKHTATNNPPWDTFSKVQPVKQVLHSLSSHVHL